MFSQKSADVLVVGAGPVGLCAALVLARGGASVSIIEKEKRTKLHSFALALHASTLRLLHGEGLAEDLVARGHRIDRVCLYDGSSQQAELFLSELGGDFPHILVLPQSDLEHALLNRLSGAGVHPLWNHELTEIQDRQGGVAAELVKIEDVTQGYPIMRSSRMRGRTFPVNAGWVIGADGYNSLVRRLIHAKFESRSSPQHFFIHEFHAEAGCPNEVRVVLTEYTTNVLWPMGGDRYRWSLELAGADAPATLAETHDLIRSRAPWFRAVPGPAEWSAVVHFDRRVVGQFGTGRTWLAGDAAHSTGPIGVQSMNDGLREGHALARALLELKKSPADTGILAAYEQECRSRWAHLLGHEPLPTEGWRTPWLRNNAPRLLPCLPATGPDLDSLLAQLRT